MSRKRNLIERIAEIDNLELAFHKAQQGKVAQAEVYHYAKNLRANLRLLQEQLLSGDVEVGGYRYFTIYDPKERQICAAPFGQRVLHHALMNVCHAFFERHQIYDSYASRPGKGTYAALERAKVFNRRYAWFLKLDVRKYFDTIHHGVLRSQLCKLFDDPRLIRIFDLILDSYQVEAGRGVPIGNLTSQYFANHYLSAADHFVKETLRIPAYVRYMDDMVLWHPDKQLLLDAGRHFQHYIETHLMMALKPCCLNSKDKGMPFLGYLLFPDKILLAYRSRRRYIDKLEYYVQQLQSGAWTQRIFQAHAMPLTAFTQHAEARGFRQKINRVILRHEEKAD